MTDRVYVWASPRDLDAAEAGARIATWEADGGDPTASPFEPSTDIGWFHRELVRDVPDLAVVSDAIPSTSSRPVWMSGTDEPPARVVVIEVGPDVSYDALDEIVSLAAKFDLVLFDGRSGRMHRPLEAMADHASATFWPAGAIRAAVAGTVGVVIAVVAWFIAIPVLSGVAIVVGGIPVRDVRVHVRPRSLGDRPSTSCGPGIAARRLTT